MNQEAFALTFAGQQALVADPPYLPPQLHQALGVINGRLQGRAQLMPLMPRGALPPAQCLDTLLLLGLIERQWVPARRGDLDPLSLTAGAFDESRFPALHRFVIEVLHAYLPPRVLQHELDSFNRLHGMRSLVRRLTPVQALLAQYADPETARQFNRAVRDYLSVAPTGEEKRLAA